MAEFHVSSANVIHTTFQSLMNADAQNFENINNLFHPCTPSEVLLSPCLRVPVLIDEGEGGRLQEIFNKGIGQAAEV